MDRRRFFTSLGACVGTWSFIGLAFKLAGCGREPTSSSVSASSASFNNRPVSSTVLVYDLVMEGWSTLGSGYLGDNGVLTASQIRDFQVITLAYVQDTHGHQFTLTEANFLALLRGEETRVLTTYALEHRHEVRIKPARRVSGSQPIEVVLDAEGRPVQM